MKRVLVSLLLLVSAPALLAGKPIHKGGREIAITAAANGYIKRVEGLVESGLVSKKTMCSMLTKAYDKNQIKVTRNRTRVIEFLFDHGAMYRP